MRIRLINVWHCLWLLGLVVTCVHAADIPVTPGQDLQLAIDSAQPGDHLILGSGVYVGNFTIETSIELSGEPGAVIDGRHRGSTLTLQGADIFIHHLEIRNWGDDLTELDAGIFIAKTAQDAKIGNNTFFGDTSGIWVDATQGVHIYQNRIEGNTSIRSQDRGNGIHLFNVTGARVEDNEIWHTRDGIYIGTSSNSVLMRNYMHDLRYGVHYMYSYNNQIVGNYTQNTRTGYALMQSKFLTVINNRSENDQNYGLLMNFITRSTIEGNQIVGVQTGRSPGVKGRSRKISGAEGKALFMYNSHFNQITGNLFSESDLGIHLTAGSEDNHFSGNAFVNNKQQVKYVANRLQDWSYQGRGNYWSDYLGWDMDGDGIGDTVYEPNDGVDKLLWKYPAAKVLLNSPAIELLRWVQRQFPVLNSPGVVDSHPLMASPYPRLGKARSGFGRPVESALAKRVE